MDLKKSLHIIDIEEELKKLWEENKNEKKIKACLFTLIVYSEECQRGNYIQRVTHALLQEYPSRIISIYADSSSKDPCLIMEVFQHTFLEEGVLIASDQITIKVSPEFIEQIPYIVTRELVPDLPVYVLWGADATKENPLLKALEKIATKILFDPESSSSLSLYSKSLLQKVETLSIELQDIHWALSGGWRECLFQAFNNPEGITFLRSINSLKIVYNEAQGSVLHKDTLAWYIQCWLASTLEWKKPSLHLEEKRTSYSSPSGAVEVEIVSEDFNSFPRGSILSIEMKNSSQEIYSFIQHQDQNKVLFHVTRKNSCEIPVVYPLQDFQKGFNFIRELFFSSPSDHYIKTLKCLRDLRIGSKEPENRQNLRF